MPSARTCPECGSDIHSDTLQGLCPRCVGRAAFADPPAIRSAGTETSGVDPAHTFDVEAESTGWAETLNATDRVSRSRRAP